MRIKTKQLYFINAFAAVLLLLPLSNLQLFSENYSTLSLNTRGYLYLLATGTVCGAVLAYETMLTGNRKYAVLLFWSLFLASFIPHHYPYDLQGNFHLFFAYAGFCVMVSVTYLNLHQNQKHLLIEKYTFSLAAALLFYLKAGMVNTICELIIMFATLSVNLFLCIKKQDHSCF
ncbi:MAG: hypothetical protein IJI44_03355 [Erysipelotrichaceae bacterium]|nr:hypothetical protein [Erysipelotrichaceae bacterium]